MRVSVRFWLFTVVVSLALRFAPVIGDYFWLRCILWYAFTQLAKRSFLFFRQLDDGVRYKNKETVMVVGASAGIGAETAKQLCQRGAKVIWAARSTLKAQAYVDEMRCSESCGPRGYVLHVDLADLESIRKFVDEFKKREEKLDCLILNAAYHGPKSATKDGFERNFGVNHLGHMYLTFLLMDVLKKSAPSRIVVVGSDLHRWTKKVRFDDLMFEKPGSYTAGGFTAYNHSKLCNLLFTRELSKRLQGSDVVVHCAHPGTPVQSELMRDNMLGTALFNNFIMPPVYHLFCRQSTDGAQNILYTAISPHLQKTSGLYFENLSECSPSAAGQDDAAAEQLWKKSCQLLNISNNWS